MKHLLAKPKKSITRWRFGQSTVELALFGTVLLFIFSILIKYGFQYNYAQRAQQLAFRKALNLAYMMGEQGQSVSYSVIRDKPIPDALDPFGVSQRDQQMAGSSTILWSNNLYGSLDWIKGTGLQLPGDNMITGMFNNLQVVPSATDYLSLPAVHMEFNPGEGGAYAELWDEMKDKVAAAMDSAYPLDQDKDGDGCIDGDRDCNGTVDVTSWSEILNDNEDLFRKYVEFPVPTHSYTTAGFRYFFYPTVTVPAGTIRWIPFDVDVPWVYTRVNTADIFNGNAAKAGAVAIPIGGGRKLAVYAGCGPERGNPILEPAARRICPNWCWTAVPCSKIGVFRDEMGGMFDLDEDGKLETVLDVLRPEDLWNDPLTAANDIIMGEVGAAGGTPFLLPGGYALPLGFTIVKAIDSQEGELDMTINSTDKQRASSSTDLGQTYDALKDLTMGLQKNNEKKSSISVDFKRSENDERIKHTTTSSTDATAYYTIRRRNYDAERPGNRIARFFYIMPITRLYDLVGSIDVWFPKIYEDYVEEHRYQDETTLEWDTPWGDIYEGGGS